VHEVASSDGVTLAVHDLGGTGPPLLLCHATGFHGLVWGPFASRLAQRFRVWSMDFRGHGDASPPPARPVDWRGFGDDVLAVVDDVALQRPFGFGHSMGGAALVLAEDARPGTFAALVLFEPIVFPPEARPGGDGDGDLTGGARRRRAGFASREEAFANFAAKPPLSAFVPDALRAYVDHGLADRPDGSVTLKCRPEDEAATYEGAPIHPGWARLAEVRCPVVVMTGEHTDAVGLERAALQPQRLPAGRLEVVPGVGHFGPMEDPSALARAVGAALLRR
jgi:pimeloyl-ACP methyl ester carboxylesterase